MNTALVIAGVVILIFGGIIAFDGLMMMESAQSVFLGTPFTDEEQYNMGQGELVLGMIIGLIGLVLAIVGFTTDSKPQSPQVVILPPQQQYQPPPQPQRPPASYPPPPQPNTQQPIQQTINQPAPQQEPTPANQAVQPKICPACGVKNAAAAKFCNACGKPF